MIYFYISMIEDESDRNLAMQLYESNEQEVYKIALAFFKNEQRAEDGVNDVFERVCKNISQFRSLDCNKATALIVVYSRNIFIDNLRCDKIIGFDELDYEMSSEGNHPENIVIEQDSYHRILTAIKGLNQKYADVCELKFVVGLPDAEIAKVLNITPENVRVRAHRGREMIRSQLTKEGEQV